jgi:hypothetical protein
MKKVDNGIPSKKGSFENVIVSFVDYTLDISSFGYFDKIQQNIMKNDEIEYQEN